MLLQDVHSYAVHAAPLSSLQKTLPPKRRPPLLRDHQQQCIEAVLSRGRCICFVKMGAGKTLISVGLYMRMLHAREGEAHRLEPGELFLVVAQANLVDTVWMKQACDFGSPETSFAIRAVGEEPPEAASFVVVSMQLLASLLKAHLNEETGLLWQRRVRVVCIDEAQKLRGDGVWCEQVGKLCRRSSFALGLTGTLFCNEPSSTAHICKALGLHREVCTEAFWSRPRAIQKAKAAPYLAIFESSGAMIPRAASVPLERLYESRDDVRGHEVLRSLGECLEGDQEFLETFHRRSRREKQDCFRSLRPGPKTRAFLDVVDKLFEEEMYKIFVTAMFKDVILLLQDFLLCGSSARHPGLRVYLHFGEQSQEENKQALRAYLDRPCRVDSKSILLLSIRSGTEGLEIVNGERSPMAHVEFEQPHTVAERQQLQARIQRPGNPYEVTVVNFKGGSTQSSKSLAKHRAQAWKHSAAGEGTALLSIKQEDSRRQRGETSRPLQQVKEEGDAPEGLRQGGVEKEVRSYPQKQQRTEQASAAVKRVKRESVSPVREMRARQVLQKPIKKE